MWRGDTGELVYITADGTFMSVRVDPAAREPFQEPVSIFKARVRFIPLDSRRYDMSPDGQRFIVELEDERPEPLVLIDNWALPEQ